MTIFISYFNKLDKTTISSQKLDQLQHLLAHEKDMNVIIDNLLTHAMEVMNSDFASIQMYNSINGSLILLGHKNFKADSARFWRIVFPGSGATCGQALKMTSRVKVSDVRQPEYIKGSGDLRSFEHCGIRSVQSTPLISSKEELFGMMSTHWRNTRDFENDDFKSFDHLASFAADLLVERKHLMEV